MTLPKATTALFLGSFNPVHRGHIKVADEILKHLATEVKRIWFIPSPQNPFKKKEDLIPIEHRLNMLKLVLRKKNRFSVCDLELRLPKPNYTFVTLRKLKEMHPQENFKIIMGEDNLTTFFQWKNAGWIQKHFPILVYPRFKNPLHPKKHKMKNISFIQGKILNISSSEIRRKIAFKVTLAESNLKPYLYVSTIRYLRKNVFQKGD